MAQGRNRVASGGVIRFGLITTNSLKQTFNRRVVEAHLSASDPVSLVYAIPDHPWVDSSDGAAVRIAMTVAAAGTSTGMLDRVIDEANVDGDDAHRVNLSSSRGRVHADLRVGANVAGAVALKANAGLSSPGVKLHGAGFIVTPEQAVTLGLGRVPGLERHIRPYLNGRDLIQISRNVMVIDFFGLDEDVVRQRFPEAYQWLLTRVKPERDAKSHSKDGAGYAKNWWLFGKPRPDLRRVLTGLDSSIVTVETSKHRLFTRMSTDILPDNMLVVIGTTDALFAGCMSSRMHVLWSLATGGRLGVGNDARYNKSRCFETFPFPNVTDAQQARIRSLAEKLDAHRKRQQAQHPDLTLTGMYNVLEKLRSGEALTAKERLIHEQGLVSVLRELHDELDRAVFEAYGWNDLAERLVGRPGATTPVPDKPADQAEAEEELLSRLVALNAERAAEEARGVVRWLRPEFQATASVPAEPSAPEQGEIDMGEEAEDGAVVASAARTPWPRELPEQMRAVARVIAAARAPLDEDAIAARFTGRGPWRRRLPQLVETLVSIGRARKLAGGRVAAVD